MSLLTKRLLPSILVLLMLAGAATEVFAGSIVRVPVTRYGDPNDSSDQTLVYRRLKWDRRDFPVNLAIYRDPNPFIGVLPPTSIAHDIELPFIEMEVFGALRRAAQAWNSAPYSDFEFSEAPMFSDQAPLPITDRKSVV